MDPVETEAVTKLQGFMPRLLEFEEELIQMKERLKVVNYYHRFKMHRDTVRINPIEELMNFYKIGIDLKQRLISFKESFNENHLSHDTRDLFMTIYVKIVSIEFNDANEVIIGGSDTWRMKLAEIIEKWNTTLYKYQVRYSTSAFNTLWNFLSLIEHIQKLDELVEG